MPQIIATYPDGREHLAFAKNPLPFAHQEYKQGANDIVLGEGEFEIDDATAVQLPERVAGFVGSGKRTVLSITATRPAKITMPGRGGYGTTRECVTEVLGGYFHSREHLCPHFRIGNFTYKGLKSAVEGAAAEHYKGLTIVAGDIEVEPIWQEHNESQSYYAATGIDAPFKPASKRNVKTFGAIQFGEDHWVQPDANKCRPIGSVRFKPGGHCLGEPIGETSSLAPGDGAVGAVDAYVFRRVGGVKWPSHGIDFGERYQPRTKLTGDLLFGAVPNVDDSFIVGSQDPFTEAITGTVYTFKDAPAGPTEVLRVVGDVAATMANARAKVQAQRKGHGGSSYVECLMPSEYFPFRTPLEQSTLDANAKRLRFQAMKVGEGATSDVMRMTPFGPLSATVQVGVNVAGAMLAVPIFTGDAALDPGPVRRGTWDRALLFEDCSGNQIGESSIGADWFRRDVLAAYATTKNLIFTPDPWAERGHSEYRSWTGETNRMRCALRVADLGWNNIDGPAFGLTSLTGAGITGGPGVKGFITIERGNHRATKLSFTGVPADTGIFRLADGNGGDKTFEFNSAGGFTGGRIEVPILGAGTTAQAAEATRQAILGQIDAHALRASCGVVIDAGGGTFTLEVTFWTPTGEYESEPLATETATNFTITDPLPSAGGTVSAPGLPRFNNVRCRHHALGTLVGNSSVCSVWSEFTQEKVAITGTIDTMRAKEAPLVEGPPGHNSQAVRLLAFNAVPAGDTTDIVLDSGAAGGPGTAVTFKIRAGGGVDDATNKFIDKTVENTVQKLETAFVAKANAAALGDTRAFAAAHVGDGGGSWFCNVIDGFDGVNNGLLNVVNGGVDIIAGADSSPGNADPALSGKLSPIVGIDSKVIDVEGLSCSTFIDAFVPQQLVYVERSSANVPSRVFLGNNRCHIRFGLGRAGVEALVSFGPNMAAAQVTNLGGNTVQNVDATIRTI